MSLKRFETLLQELKTYMETLMEYSPTEAISAVQGLNRKLLYAMIKAGEISVTGEQRNRKIAGSELARVFGHKFLPLQKRNTEETFLDDTTKRFETSKETHETKDLRHTIELLRQQLAFKEETLSDVRNRLSDTEQEKKRLLDVVERQTLLLEHKQSVDMPLEGSRKTAEASNGFFGMFSRRRA